MAAEIRAWVGSEAGGHSDVAARRIRLAASQLTLKLEKSMCIAALGAQVGSWPP